MACFPSLEATSVGHKRLGRLLSTDFFLGLAQLAGARGRKPEAINEATPSVGREVLLESTAGLQHVLARSSNVLEGLHRT